MAVDYERLLHDYGVNTRILAYTLKDMGLALLVGFLLLLGIMQYYYFVAHQSQEIDQFTVVPQLDQAFVSTLPRRSETATGGQADPVNLVIVGQPDDISRAFTAAGWSGADEFSPLNIVRGFGAMVFDQPYPTGPITPLFIDHRPQYFSFQEPTADNSFRVRHHVRVWRTPYVYQSRPVWLAAATFDKGIRFTYEPLFLTHRIDGNLDTERSNVVSELRAHGASSLGAYQLHEPGSLPDPEHAKSYETDGKVNLLEFK